MHIRNAFEQWFSVDWKYPESIEKTDDGRYKNAQAHITWEAWQAALNARLPNQCPLCGYSHNEEPRK